MIDLISRITIGRLSLIPVFVFVGTVLACEQNSVNVNQSAEPVYRQAENFTFYTSMDMYAELQNHRSDEKSEPFEILDVNRTEKDGLKYLEIKIVHKICEPDPRIIWNGSVADSWPPQVFLFVQLLTNHECEIEDEKEEKTEIFSLDLYDFISDEFTVENAVFRVLNASKTQNDNDHSDKPVSSEAN